MVQPNDPPRQRAGSHVFNTPYSNREYPGERVFVVETDSAGYPEQSGGRGSRQTARPAGSRANAEADLAHVIHGATSGVPGA
jgi:hypothetical protein